MNPIIAAAGVFLLVFVIGMLIWTAMGSEDQRRQDQTRRRLEAVYNAARRRESEGDDQERLGLLREELLGSVPVLDRWLIELDILPGLRQRLVQSGVGWSVGDLLLRCLAAALLSGILIFWRTNSVMLAIALGAAMGAIPNIYVTYKLNRRMAEFERQLPGALDLISRALKAGHGLVSGLEMVATEIPDPIGGEFSITFEEQNYGLELREALLNLMDRVPIQDVRIVVTAILIQRETGGNLAEILSKAARVIRERYRLRREIRTKTAQGRVTGWTLACLPFATGFALFLLRPDLMSVLWTHETGIKILVIAIILQIIGFAVIRRIVNIRVS